MSKYRNVKVSISDSQKDKFKHALESGVESLSIRLSHQDLDSGIDILALTGSQVDKLTKAYQSGQGVTIKLSKTQLKHNLKVEGGFLPALAALIPAAIAALKFAAVPLATGALAGLGGVAAKKIAGNGVGRPVGNGLYLKRGGCVCQIETDGKGLYLGPANGSGFQSSGDGLYLKRQGGVLEGSGMLLGKNSPYKNIPFLKMLL
jgi:hypothetical protein